MKETTKKKKKKKNIAKKKAVLWNTELQGTQYATW